MKAFFDTSALIKNYIVEAGTEKVASLLQSAEGVFVSAITVIECASVLSRLEHEGAITESQVRAVMTEMEKDFRFFEQVNLNSDLQEAAKRLALRRKLKTLDSIQLASAVIRKREIDVFIASDKRLSAVAKAEGFKVEDPTA